MQIHKLIIFLLLTTQQLIKSTEQTYLFYANHKNGFIDEKKDIDQNIQQFFIFYLTDNEYDKNISINCKPNEYYKLKNKNTDINTNNNTINIDFLNNTCEIINNTDHTTIKNFNIKNYPIIIFEVKEKESDEKPKFIYYIDSNTLNINRAPSIGIFRNYNIENPNIKNKTESENPWAIIKIKKIFNKDKWINIANLCESNQNIELFDFGNTKLNIQTAFNAFARSNIKNVNNIKSLFTEDLTNIENIFTNTKIEEINLSHLMLPKFCDNAFKNSNLKKISLNETDMQYSYYLHSFLANTKVEEIDFSTVKNIAQIGNVGKLVTGCKNLKTIKLGKLVSDNTTYFQNMFEDTPELETIDISELKVHKDLELFNENSLNRKRNIILPNDKQSAINCLKNIQAATHGASHFPNITYKDKTLENFFHFDDINKFMNDPNYNAERFEIQGKNMIKYMLKVEDIKEQLKKSNNKQETLKEILKNHKLTNQHIKELEKIASKSNPSKQQDQSEEAKQPEEIQLQRINLNRHKSKNNSCCKQCCCCCCK